MNTLSSVSQEEILLPVYIEQEMNRDWSSFIEQPFILQSWHYSPPNRPLYPVSQRKFLTLDRYNGLGGGKPCLSFLNTWPSVSNEEILLPPLISDDETVLPPLISDDEIVLSAFVEQEFLIPDDAECGISFESPNCRTSCGHYFCRADITIWLEQQKNEYKKMTCPTCRAEITRVFVAKNK